MAHPVFYDPKRGRWRRLRRLLDIAGILVSAVIVVFVYTATREPLPKLLLPFEKRPYHALKDPYKGLKEAEKEKAREKRNLLVRRLMDDHRYQDAYDLVKEHGLSNGENFAKCHDIS